MNNDTHIGFPTTNAAGEQETHFIPDPTPGYDMPDEYFDKYIYDVLYCNSMCASCIHWNGYRCTTEQSPCRYQPN